MIDAHAHLWLCQKGKLGDLPVYDIGGGRSMFGNEIRQMLPPYMTDGVNSAERFLANMDFAGVGGAVLTQEYIDGNQDAYLKQVRTSQPERFRVTCLYEEKSLPDTEGFDGIKLCGGRMADTDFTHHEDVFRLAAEKDMFIAIDMADGDIQTGSLREMARTYPNLRIAIGHFGMVTRPKWQEQIKLARLDNVSIESGGITWLFNDEYYPYPSAIRAILEARDICGMEKLMWGSDYPRTMTAITYLMSLDFVTGSKELTGTEKDMFLHSNARCFYRFGVLPDLPRIHHMAE
ncbi:MAG: amidohydrolase [Clostridiales bacterium]|nr:amidohydrolase [Clostridiales bacterium]